MATNLTSLYDFETKAKDFLPKRFYEYFRSGSDNEVTLARNESSFKSISIVPRVMRNVSTRTTTVNIFDGEHSFPVGVAPVPMQKVVHPDGEIAAAKAAGKLETVYISSIMSNTSIEELAAEAPETTKWLQVYIYKDRSITESCIKRAERAGFKAIVITVDAPVRFLRRADKAQNFDIQQNLTLANLPAELKKEQLELNGTFVWSDLTWLRSLSSLPIILKGILSVQDAVLAAEHGVHGILVSNHGGRQLDGVPSTIEVLPQITEAVGNRLVVMMDGGIRQGTDVLKAVALGAKMVFVGRPVVWGLAVEGETGVEMVLRLLRREFDRAMALSGCKHIRDINKDLVDIGNCNCCKCKCAKSS